MQHRRGCWVHPSVLDTRHLLHLLRRHDYAEHKTLLHAPLPPCSPHSTCFPSLSTRSEIDPPVFLQRWADVRRVFADTLNINPKTLLSMCQALDVPFIGKAHSGASSACVRACVRCHPALSSCVRIHARAYLRARVCIYVYVCVCSCVRWKHLRIQQPGAEEAAEEGAEAVAGRRCWPRVVTRSALTRQALPTRATSPGARWCSSRITAPCWHPTAR